MNVGSPNLPPNPNRDVISQPSHHEPHPRPTRRFLIPTHHHAENQEPTLPKLDKAGVRSPATVRLGASSDCIPSPNHLFQPQLLRSCCRSHCQITSTPPPPQICLPLFLFLFLLPLPFFFLFHTNGITTNTIIITTNRNRSLWVPNTEINATVNPACEHGGNTSLRRKSPARMRHRRTHSPARRLRRWHRSMCLRRPAQYSDVR